MELVMSFEKNDDELITALQQQLIICVISGFLSEKYKNIRDISLFLAQIFGIDKSGISRHLAKIFETGELDEEVVVAKIATTTQHGAMQGKTQTNVNCWKESAPSEPANAEYGNRLQIFLQNAVLIMI